MHVNGFIPKGFILSFFRTSKEVTKRIVERVKVVCGLPLLLLMELIC